MSSINEHWETADQKTASALGTEFPPATADEKLPFTGERLVPGAENCEPLFARKMYQEHSARYLFAAQACAGKRVLDVGCGAGYGARLLAESGAHRVVAFDISAEAVAHAERFYRHPAVQFRIASAETFAFGERFDVITSFELIEHVNDQEAVVERIAEHLAPDGLLFMSTPRALATRRSEFHTRELSEEGFESLLRRRFPHFRIYVENNHFASLITAGAPSHLQRISFMEPRTLAREQCDYFIAVASNRTLVTNFEPQVVFNDDRYVTLQERDVAILHQLRENAEKTDRELRELLARRETLVNELKDLLERRERELGHLGGAKAHLERRNRQILAERASMERTVATLQSKVTLLQDRLDASAHQLDASAQQLRQMDHLASEVRRLSESRSWRYTQPLRTVKKTMVKLASPLRQAIRRPPERDEPAAMPVEASPTEDASAAAFAQPVARPYSTEVIFIIGCHEGESKRYRVYNVQEALERVGVRSLVFPDAEIPRLLSRGFDAEAVVLFRVAFGPIVSELVAEVRRRGSQLFFDVDDLIFEPENIRNVRVVQTFDDAEREQYLDGVRRYRQTLLAADYVICPTRYLAARAEALGRPAIVVPNSVNRHQMAVASALLSRERGGSETVRIGYFSGTNTHQIDFQECEAALLRLFAKYPQCRFVLVGTLSLSAGWEPFLDRVERLPFQPPDGMLEALARTDINIAPVEVGNPYCESKSQLKVFEAGLLEVPSVASATSSFRDAVDSGVDGFLAVTSDEWFEALEKLVVDPVRRADIGRRARERTLRDFAQTSIAERAKQALLSPWLTLSPNRRTLAVSKPMRISWVIPGLQLGSGGHRNILRAAYHLQRFGHDISLYFTNTDLPPDDLARMVQSYFYPLDCPILPYDGNIAPTDVLCATHWSTVDVVLTHQKDAKLAAYFIQDFEPFFYPIGSEYLLAENTYRQGLYHVTLGPWCAHILKTHFGVPAVSVDFPIDAGCYHPGHRDEESVRRLLFFGRPEMPRRCFELGLQMLTHLHRLEPTLEIVIFGSTSLENRTYPFPVTVRGLVLTPEELAALYRGSDLGVAFSTTNPSSVGYEMLACGLPVVDIGRPESAVNYGGRSDVALLADPRPEVMALQIQALLCNPGERARRSQAGIDLMKRFPSDEEAIRGFERLLADGLRASAVAEDQAAFTAQKTPQGFAQ
jgi:2-polyprenyl-3-methyl-5-hydroxy-6-metoxy-1,4-benzoquinol methylase/glycosyltransferase involved in cell wall biosynthesis